MIGRFVPVVRTYVTVVAGASKMKRPRFLAWSLIGALLWVLSITLTGYFVGDTFPWLAHHIDYLILGLLAAHDHPGRHPLVARARLRPLLLRSVTAVTFSGVDYRLAAAGREAAEDERLDLLEQIYDPVSRRRRALVQPGWRCLEVGAGRGSMAVWLAEQVGATGHVVATDVDTRYLSRLELPNLEVIEHNILEDPLDVLGPVRSISSARD